MRRLDGGDSERKEAGDTNLPPREGEELTDGSGGSGWILLGGGNREGEIMADGGTEGKEVH